MSKRKNLINLSEFTDENNKKATNKKQTAEKKLSNQEKYIQDLEKKAEKRKQPTSRKRVISPKQAKKAAGTEGEAKAFRMISKIEPQRRKGRYNIYINDEFAFGVDEEVLLKFNLNKGMHVTSALQKEIEADESYYKAFQKTLNYLSYSLRSKKQIRDYLQKNEFEHYSERMIVQLEEMRLLDDLNYAESYVRTMANINRKGPRNVEQDLKQRGIAEADIMTALDGYSYEQQLENALYLAEKKWNKTQNSSTFESIQKVKQYIVNKGYSFEIADEVIEQLDTEKDEAVEYEALVKQAEKAIRRYARKHEGYELTQRLKAYLYSKAYPTELINRYLDERELE